MKAKTVVPRRQASLDAGDAINHYLREAGEKVALGFIDALERAYRSISNHPAAGSRRYAHELGFPSLRSWVLKQYLYIVFYVDLGDHIDTWGVLHGNRDVAAWLEAPDDDF